MDWLSAFWIILTGVLVAASCGLLGCFLILRRTAMLGDAISHAVLLGIVAAFMLTGGLNPIALFIGAAAAGVLTTFLVQFLSSGGVHKDAALGVTFASFFALGVIGVSKFGEGVHLDIECVLEGEIAFTPLDLFYWGDRSLGPRAVWINGFLLLLNVVVIGLFYKELKIVSFDPNLAAAAGISVPLIHYLLMTLTAVTVVGAFQSVGVILVVAMLIAPAAAAYLLTDRLGAMLIASVGIGALAALSGYAVGTWLDASIAGAMGTMTGVLFAVAFFFSPRHGVAARWWAQQSLRRRVAEEDLLLWAGRQLETGGKPLFNAHDISQAQQWLLADASSAANRLVQQGLLRQEGSRFALSPRGENSAGDLIKRHRLYEAYLGEIGYPSDHMHDAADRVEHHIPPELIDRIDDAADHPVVDPHGRIIPRHGEE